jgi:small subunit ribosomal protein S13
LIIYLLRGFILSDSKIKRNIDNNINKAITNGSYKGTRHKLALPVRGQRSRTNSATQRSKRTI